MINKDDDYDDSFFAFSYTKFLLLLSYPYIFDQYAYFSLFSKTFLELTLLNQRSHGLNLQIYIELELTLLTQRRHGLNFQLFIDLDYMSVRFTFIVNSIDSVNFLKRQSIITCFMLSYYS